MSPVVVLLAVWVVCAVAGALALAAVIAHADRHQSRAAAGQRARLQSEPSRGSTPRPGANRRGSAS